LLLTIIALVYYTVNMMNETPRAEKKYSSRPDFQKKTRGATYVGESNGRSVLHFNGRLWVNEESNAGSWGKLVEVFLSEITSWNDTRAAREAKQSLEAQS
jgi:hypothetical protein